MTSRRLALLLQEMNLAARQALSFVETMDFDIFSADEKTQNAVGMCLVRIGEQAAKIIKDFPDFAGQYPDVPWESMRGMRNRLAHTYSETTLQTVWDTVKIFIPQLISELKKLDLKSL